MKIAYMMSRFPKLTETFILYEILAVKELGHEVSIYPLMKETTTVVHEEARELVDQAHYTPFVSLKMVGVNLRTIFSNPATYFRTLATVIRSNWGSTRFLLGALAYFPKAVLLADMMRKDGIEHLHAHFASFPAATAYMIHQFSGIPYSFTAHGSDLHRDQHMLCEKIQDADKVISISSYNRQMMIDHCGDKWADKIHIVHCGINLKQFKAETELPQKENLSIICIGSLHEVKGQSYLIKACGSLKQQGIPFECHLIGDGEDRELLTQLADKLGIAEQIIFHGKLTQPDVIKQLKQANVAALCSVPTADGRREGIPVALMESMAFSLPVVSTRLSGIPELVDEGVTGFLTEARDDEAIADALAKLANDPELRRSMGKAGRTKIEQEFDLKQNSSELLRVLMS